jgi:hypothetical protein
MSGFKNTHYYPFCYKRDKLDLHLADSLSRLRMSFVLYRKTKAVNENKFIDIETKRLYNLISWRTSKNKIIIESNKRYLELRNQIFKEYYQYKNGDTSLEYERKDNQFLFFDYYYKTKKEVRHTLQKTIVVHKIAFDALSVFQVSFDTLFKFYCESYIKYCLKNNCFNDSFIKKINPNNISIKKMDIFGHLQEQDILKLLKLINKNPTVDELRNHIKIKKPTFYGFLP